MRSIDGIYAWYTWEMSYILIIAREVRAELKLTKVKLRHNV